MIEEKEMYPKGLESTQKWFADIITTKLEDEYIRPITNHGTLIAEEASHYITPSKSLQSYQRIQIYNQQYWWRLLKALHENFPLVTRLFGYYAFNEEIAIPYLLTYPPQHWSLNVLGDRLYRWIEEEYRADDKSLILNATALDWACNASFVAEQKTHLDSELLGNHCQEALLGSIFYLQPHIHLFQWDYDLFTFRDEFLLKDIDYWTEHPFPALSKARQYHFIIFRSFSNEILWKEISAGEYLVLSKLKEGCTIDQLCAYLETQAENVYQEIAENLQRWLHNYTVHRWLTLDG